MEMERINDDVIRVIIKSEDLVARGINFLELIGDQSGIERFFYSILEEVDLDGHFLDSDALTFQVIPNVNGLELYISRADADDIEGYLHDELSKRLEQLSQIMDDDPPVSFANRQFVEEERPAELKTPRGVEHLVVVFDKLDDFIAYARQSVDQVFETSLYHLKDKYFLVLDDHPDTKEAALVNVLEFGQATEQSKDVLEEHGDLIRQGDAVNFFGANL